MKKLLLVIPILAVLLIWWLLRQRSAPPETPFARVTRGTLVSTLVTNGKVEPLQWVAVNAESGGVVEKANLEHGTRVTQGSLLAVLGSADARSGLAAAQARLEQAEAELEVIRRGGRASELAQIDGELASARQELDAARTELGASKRLFEKQAATRQEVEEAGRRVQRAELQIRTLESRRTALVGQADRMIAEAKVREAAAAVETANRRLGAASIRAPMAGVMYDAVARVGSYLNPGDPVTKIGRTDSVRVRVYVDEPELGHVAVGMPVAITWDAMANLRWQGTVERMPSEVAALGTRQVGEVVCVIENPGRELLPGTNVNAEIRSAEVQNALSIPREALRREAGQPGVYLLQGDRVAWRKIGLGVSSITRMQVIGGLAEGDAVALPGQTVLADGVAVRPVYR